MECAPSASEVVLKVAVVIPAVVESVAVPIVEPASLKVTVPVGFPGPDVDMVAVNTTAAPGCEGFTLERTAACVGSSTFCVSAVDELGALRPSPLWTAV